MYQPDLLQLVEAPHLPTLDGFIPSAPPREGLSGEPSDHLAIKARFLWTQDHTVQRDLAKAWLGCVLDSASFVPLNSGQLAEAFQFFRGRSFKAGAPEQVLSRDDLEEGIAEVSAHQLATRSPQRTGLATSVEKSITPRNDI